MEEQILYRDIPAWSSIDVFPEDQKLPIMRQGRDPVPPVIVKAVCLDFACNQTRHSSDQAKRLLLNGVCAALDLGLICMYHENPDGDWRWQQDFPKITDERVNLFKELLTVEDMKKAVTIILATKSNWWLMNHYIGQGGVQGYVKKVLEIFYEQCVTEDIIHAVHCLGRYTSTLKVLWLAGIRNIKVVTPVIHTEAVMPKFADNIKLRFTSMPAGTHRLAVAFEAAKRLVRSSYAAYCPAIQDFLVLPELRANVINAPERYHIEALYLTGEARADYSDTDCDSYLGRLGTFINTLYKNSTLAKSPHLAAAKVESYADYDVNFKNCLTRMQQAFTVHSDEVVQAVRQKFFEAQVAAQPAAGPASGNFDQPLLYDDEPQMPRRSERIAKKQEGNPCQEQSQSP